MSRRPFVRISKTKRVHVNALTRNLAHAEETHRAAVEAAAIQPGEFATAAADRAFRGLVHAKRLLSRRKP
jgi:hypothetical protein